MDRFLLLAPFVSKKIVHYLWSQSWTISPSSKAKGRRLLRLYLFSMLHQLQNRPRNPSAGYLEDLYSV